MKILVTGSAGHLGEALVRSLAATGHEAVGIDIKASEFTCHIGSIVDSSFVDQCMSGVDAVLHAATLHKPHVATHSRQDFVDTNISGTLNLLESSVRARVKSFVYTSTTSTFGDSMRPEPGGPAVWVSENLQPSHKNIYGVTKTCAEGLCQLFNRNMNLPCIVLRTSRFFPEEDDNKSKREGFVDDNLKVNEFLFRRVDVQDIVTAHMLAIEKATQIGFDRFIISATTPFRKKDALELGSDVPAVLKRYVPDYAKEYQRRNWKMFQSIGRVYDNSHARDVLGWQPKYTFNRAIRQLAENKHYQSELALLVGAKGYHDSVFADGPYPVEESPLTIT